ncbi:class I SAM-dependent methyltransferase [Cryomorpha ignava]|uniref:Class I SAM-dependent methyltransferase n=1 Tax=Cryomorpha ignava TaxID=101383 RepID=A0A7K3WPG4_9FLAO|nr:class I SAM-dependent methyltransferase [Cryomorpha ignava]NEN23404.1 class I SAM-dependent methyltransferase [Cryomorpha ignava]
MRDELKLTSDYYTKKILEHGANPKGVDWNGEESQFVRFAQLAKVFSSFEGTCADIGCGYGAFLDYLSVIGGKDLAYTGYDLSQPMIEAAKEKHKNQEGLFKLINTISEIEKVDYAVASGIYNVRQSISDGQWKEYIWESLNEINGIVKKGFAFNILTAYSDADKRRDYLYYAEPEEVFAFCKKEFSRNVSLLHDYNLYEFTIIVRK